MIGFFQVVFFLALGIFDRLRNTMRYEHWLGGCKYALSMNRKDSERFARSSTVRHFDSAKRITKFVDSNSC